MTDIKYLKESKIWESMDEDYQEAIIKAYNLFESWSTVSMSVIFNEVLENYDTFKYRQTTILNMASVLNCTQRFFDLKDIMNLIAVTVKHTTEVWK